MSRTAIKYTQWSLNTFPSLMEFDIKGCLTLLLLHTETYALFRSFADRDVNSPIFLSPVGDEKNSLQSDSSRINDDNKEEFAFKTDTATTTLIRLVPR